MGDTRGLFQKDDRAGPAHRARVSLWKRALAGEEITMADVLLASVNKEEAATLVVSLKLMKIEVKP